jgi:opacity protein-like surface antigen
MKKFFLRIITIILTCGALAPVYATEANDNTPVSDSQPLLISSEEPWYTKFRYPHLFAVAVGPVFSSDVGESQNFPIINPDTDSFYNYSKNNQIRTAAQFELFVGDVWALNYPWKLAGGVNYSQTTNFSTHGTLTQGADEQSQDQYTYKYIVKSRQLEAKGKISYNYPGPVFPYVSLGLGAAFNTANNFQTSAPEFQATTRNFASNTKTSFTYTLGVGAEFEVAPHMQLGFGYEFSNNGFVSFGDSSITGIPVIGTLSQSHLYTHTVMTQFSYFIENQYNSTLKQLTDWS